jgi:hypothetical protein
MTDNTRQPERCKKCGQTFKRLALVALLKDLGAKTNSDPSLCDDGSPHEFEEAE